MTQPWLPLLPAAAQINEQGAVIADTATDAKAATTQASLAPLPSQAVIRVTGADAAEFLHSQLSNDIRGLGEAETCLAAYCNPKGRMLALFRVVRDGDDFLLLLERELMATVLPRLKMFVLRAKVTLSEETEMLALGIARTEAPLKALFGDLPQGKGVVRDTNAYLLRLPSAERLYLLLAKPAEMSRYWPSLTADAAVVGTAAWRLLMIRAGLPDVFGATQESLIPQTVNLDLLDGINFKKGCYPGQEIVARMHYLGKLKRRMYRVRVASQEIAAGGEVRDAKDALVGELVLAAPSDEDGCSEALAVLRIDRLEDPNLHVGKAPVGLLTQAYEIPQE
ncbi:hypothetical protein CAI21_12335 [Alkalilimnicola ehrlichii]|uniref:CAF17 C-terminal domain-containing protein n=1 Tax=Alkalilimnicola ehrlichii TaxID=351052 RepID=A0A3E0X063_9GAMM|nr:folate-binding protein YgfZ [Alkalilimnicola ehrlichii]RFA28360.1 hypothetical protein CAI21_12335 [Alkalilimnicola ehrlichii]RFA38575.1 hypothetical protein CAL65_04325 [Alkalilimnicola ehrlichii]